MQSSSTRKSGPTQSLETDCPLKKQLKIGESREMLCASNHNKTLSQAETDHMVLDFAIEGLLPFRFVSLTSFNRLIKAMSPRFNVTSESTLKRRYSGLATTISQNIKLILNDVGYVATTTDGWSIRGCSFVGATAHWIDPKTIKRLRAALSCERLQGSHTYDVLAGALSSIHIKFGISKRLSPPQLTMPPTMLKLFVCLVL